MPTRVHALREVSIQQVIVLVHKTTHTVSHLEEEETTKKRQILLSYETSTKFRVQASLLFSCFSLAMSMDDVPGAEEKSKSGPREEGGVRGAFSSSSRALFYYSAPPPQAMWYTSNTLGCRWAQGWIIPLLNHATATCGTYTSSVVFQSEAVMRQGLIRKELLTPSALKVWMLSAVFIKLC